MENTANIGFLTVQISAPIYCGLRYTISNDRLLTLTKNEVIHETKNFMRSFFGTHNLLELQYGVDKLRLYIHDTLGPDKVVYACVH